MIVEVRVVDDTLPVRVVFSRLTETNRTLFGGVRSRADIEIESSESRCCRKTSGKLPSSRGNTNLMQRADLVEVVYASGRRVYIKDRTGLFDDPKRGEALAVLGW